MSISKAVVLCCTLMGVNVASAQDVSVDTGRIVVTLNPLTYQPLGTNLSVPPDPYRSALHNPPGYKTLVNDLSVPPDPYLVADKVAIESKTTLVNVMHNPPGY